jgi:hypothetical protein
VVLFPLQYSVTIIVTTICCVFICFVYDLIIWLREEVWDGKPNLTIPEEWAFIYIFVWLALCCSGWVLFCFVFRWYYRVNPSMLSVQAQAFQRRKHTSKYAKFRNFRPFRPLQRILIVSYSLFHVYHLI